MAYKVFCSDGYKPDVFYCDSADQADLLFRMAVESKMFEYVELAQTTEGSFMIREWSMEDEK